MELELRAWSEFEGALQRINEQRTASAGRRMRDLLFRGLGNSVWGLETTLERSHPLERRDSTLSLLQYFRVIGACRPALETFGGMRWDGLPAFPEFRELLSNGFATGDWLDTILGRTPDFYPYLIFLRHHGFPSPLLDWSASPYVAAFFAFDSPPNGAKRVAIYALMQDTISGLSADAHLVRVDSHVRAHARHLLQQCSYTMCAAIDVENKDWVFCHHRSGLGSAKGPKGELFTITIPIGERLSALKQLELMNINAFSLFGSDDSLIRTVARRELLFRD